MITQYSVVGVQSRFTPEGIITVPVIAALSPSNAGLITYASFINC